VLRFLAGDLAKHLQANLGAITHRRQLGAGPGDPEREPWPL